MLQVEPDVWCDICGVPCATTVDYVTEDRDGSSWMLHRLTYCEACEQRQTTE